MVQIYVYSSLDSELQKPPCYTHVIQLLFDSIFDMYFIFYIIFPFYVLLFFVCRLYIGFSFIIDSMLFFILCLFLVIISEIGIIVCDYIIIDISFILFVVLGYGYIILVIWGIIELFISQNWDLFIRFLFCLCFFGMGVRDSFIILEV